MNCPIDGTTLAITDRQGIEIDYCPSCRGVWLDRGELDKLIERSEREPSRVDEPRRRDYDDDDRRRGDREHHRDYPRSHKRKKSLLGDIFDFG